MIDKTLFKKLEETESTYKSLQEKLADPTILANQTEYQKTTRNLKKLEKTVEQFVLYKSLTKQMEEAKQIIKEEKDQELIEMARLEFEEAEAKLPTKANSLLKLLKKLKKSQNRIVIQNQPLDLKKRFHRPYN